jgi:SAM-dependent methyltransferase
MPGDDSDVRAEPVAVRAELFDILFGFARTQALYVCVQLGLPELIGDDPVGADQLAARVSADPSSLYRLLRFLASIGVFAEAGPGLFTETRLSAGLREDAPLSLRYLVLMNGSELYRAWGDALYSVRTGKPAFEHVYGKPHFAYLAENPGAARIFNRAMADAAVGRAAALSACDWSATRAVADIGGGDGTLLTRLLQAHDGLRGVVFDLPHAEAAARSVIEAAGLADRCEFVAGDFFTDRLPAADTYVLATVLHDWDDVHAAAILANCRRSLPGGGRLLLLEAVMPAGPEPNPVKVLDLQMLVIPGGQERTEAQWRTLLASGGFELADLIPGAGTNLIEARLPSQSSAPSARASSCT